MFVGVRVLSLWGGQLCPPYIFDYIHLGGRYPAAIHARNFQLSSDVQRHDRVLQNLCGHAGIHQGAEEHVAADAGKAIKVSNSHAGSLSLAAGRGPTTTDEGPTTYHRERHHHRQT